MNINIFVNKILLKLIYFLGVLVYTNEGGNAKMLKAKIYYLSKSIIKSYNVIINDQCFETVQ